MKILSLYWGICSSASIFIDNKVIAATHEERFTRIKNDDAFPQQAIDYCLKESGLAPNDLDGVAIASFEQGFDYTILREAHWSIEDYLNEQKDYWYPTFYEGKKLEKIDVFKDKIDLSAYPTEYWDENYQKSDRNEKFLDDRRRIVAKYLDISENKVHCLEHHRCHAYYAYYTSPFRNEKVLTFTVDAYGDGLNAAISIFDEKGSFERVYQTGICNIGRIYRYITLILGMKPNEHEYKVMGLAPYGKAKYAQKALDVFKKTLYVDGIDFKWNEKPTDSYFWFKERLEGIRFDNVAWALQTWVEDLLLEWVENAINKFGIKTIAFSGGVAMNIKAMGKIANLESVDKMFVGGSGSDESMSISSGIYLAEDITKNDNKNWNSNQVNHLPNLYLGPNAAYDDERKLINEIDSSEYNIIENPTSEFIAEQLYEGKIVARSAGRMEFGQRSLGNRSILADPANLRVKEKINAAIKNRDFWMPFAPVVLDQYVNKYLLNPKKLQSPHMTIGFETTPEGYDAMIAACHPADKTARPQILVKEANPEYYEIIEEFEKLSGRGALLNTSFNLHGFPIVNTPQEAFYVFENSKLDILLLNNFLISKK